MNHTLYGSQPNGRGRPRLLPVDTEGRWTGLVFGSAMYAGVAHSLFNEVKCHHGESNEMIIEAPRYLPAWIWELVRENEEGVILKKRSNLEQKALENVYLAKRRIGGTYATWPSNIKRIAVEILFDRM